MSTSLESPDIVVLWIEDSEPLLNSMITSIRSTYSLLSEGVRSFQRTRELIQMNNYHPHIAFHDCSVLYFEEDQIPSTKAGDAVYKLLIRRRIPVVVCSGRSSDLLKYEPYRSNQPLTFIEKPVEIKDIHEAISQISSSSWKRH